MNSVPEDSKGHTAINNNKNTAPDALDYLKNTRGLNTATLTKYGVGKGSYSFPSEKQNGQYVSTECITFPWIMTVKDVKEQENLRGASFSHCREDGTELDDSEFVTRRIKVRALVQKGWQRMDPAGGGWGLFGFHTVPENATEIVLTEGEYDAMVSRD
jgi:twinkle protein